MLPPHWAMLLPFPYRVAWPNECARSDRRPEKLIPPLISQIFPSDIAVLLEFWTSVFCMCVYVCVYMQDQRCGPIIQGMQMEWASWPMMRSPVRSDGRKCEWRAAHSFIHLSSSVLLHFFYHSFISYLTVHLCCATRYVRGQKWY